MSPRAMFWANVALAVLCLAVAVPEQGSRARVR